MMPGPFPHVGSRPRQSLLRVQAWWSDGSLATPRTGHAEDPVSPVMDVIRKFFFPSFLDALQMYS